MKNEEEFWTVLPDFLETRENLFRSYSGASGIL
jgi:hypothetical protein